MLLKGEEVCIKLLYKLKTKFALLCSSLSEFVPFCIPNFGTNLSCATRVVSHTLLSKQQRLEFVYQKFSKQPRVKIEPRRIVSLSKSFIPAANFPPGKAFPPQADKKQFSNSTSNAKYFPIFQLGPIFFQVDIQQGDPIFSDLAVGLI